MRKTVLLIDFESNRDMDRNIDFYVFYWQKSYPKASHGSRNVLNVKYGSQLLCDNNRLSNQLLLSSELHLVVISDRENPDFPRITLQGVCKGSMTQYEETQEFLRFKVQINVAWSSRGVGWTNGYCHIVIVTRTLRLAHFWTVGSLQI